MSPEPASAINISSLSPRGVIALFLTRLLAYLVRLEASHATFIRPDIANMVISADRMVQNYVRKLTVEQLKRAGYITAARAICDSLAAKNRRSRSDQGEAGSDIVKHTPTELIARLETTIETFERSDALANTLARIIVYTLVYFSAESSGSLGAVCAETRHQMQTCRVGFSPPAIIPVGQGPPYIWPPPLHLAFNVDLLTPQTPAQAQMRQRKRSIEQN